MLTGQRIRKQVRYRFTWVMLTCLLGWLPVQAQMGFQVSPSKLYLTRTSQSEQTVLVHLKNTMNVPLVLQTSCADWRRDSTANKVYYPPGTLPTSCCPFVRITPTTIELAPAEERDVLVTVRTSTIADDGMIRTGMLFLTQVNDPMANRIQASQIIIKVQIGVMVYILPSEGSQPAIAIKGMSVSRAGEQYQVKVQIHNEGRALLESQLRLEYLNMDTMEEEKVEPIPVNTMPNDAFSVVAAIPTKLPTGKYLIVAILDSGPGQTLKVAELETVLK